LIGAAARRRQRAADLRRDAAAQVAAMAKATVGAGGPFETCSAEEWTDAFSGSAGPRSVADGMERLEVLVKGKCRTTPRSRRSKKGRVL
jgi:hypothetical protein